MQNGSKPRGRSHSRGGESRAIDKRKCYFCNEEGHILKFCPKLKAKIDEEKEKSKVAVVESFAENEVVLMDELSDAVDYAKVPRHLRGHDTKDVHHTTEKGVLEEPNPSLDNRHNRATFDEVCASYSDFGTTTDRVQTKDQEWENGLKGFLGGCLVGGLVGSLGVAGAAGTLLYNRPDLTKAALDGLARALIAANRAGLPQAALSAILGNFKFAHK
ncbi:hypothetical protein RHGRI_004431 [Rhododendron griersonianum]|uniref:CCHC-type domain-containing protein n=1 Tax=Rhododendron griersonianum TaxID=479676 RepID=A0AAV6L8V6_9ERIC|nr:hypothetical protein RHGRI_004431 [Rhododendron griersonianum]